MTQTKQIQEPDLSTVLGEAKNDLKTTFNCIQIGEIKAFDPAKQIASIQLVLKQVSAIAPDGTKTLVDHPLLLECPVMTLFGGNSFINLPITIGDNCIVLFNDREIDNWVYNGGTQTPTTQRKHDISDAIAIVGIRNFQNSLANFLANGVRAWFSANSNISLTDDLIHSVAGLFRQEGDLRVEGDFYITGDVYGENGGSISVKTDIVQTAGKSIHAGNGATGAFNTVTVVDGIVISGV